MAGAQAEIADLLQASLNPAQQKQAEAAIRERETQPNFSLALLQIAATDSFPLTTRLSSSLYFKNLIRRKWTDVDGNHGFAPDEVSAIKREIVGLMTQVPSNIQAQLGDAVTVIAESDFWQRWDTLIDDLVSRLNPETPLVNNGVLQVAHAIFKRWRPLFRSDDLYTEINHVVEKFCTPFLSLLQATDAKIEANAGNKPLLEQYTNTLNISIKLLHDLSCQDVPEPLVENLKGICGLLEKYLEYDNPLLRTDDDDEVGLLENTKGEILELLTLWVKKYEDDVNPYVGQFANTSWTLLTNVGPEVKYDGLASRALLFLTSVTGIKQHAESFNNEEILKQVIEKVILPNLALRESDIEMFEDEPIEFIRRDLEGTDSETRRRAATDFLRQLMRQFSNRVTTLTMTYVNHYLAEFTSNPAANWKSKDTAIYLFCSIAATGTVTSTHGVTIMNPDVNLLEFFQTNIAASLVTDQSHQILQVDAIKFLYLFRSQLSPQHWQEAFPLLVKHIGSPNYVVRTYAAIAIERILYITDPTTNQPYVTRDQLRPLTADILKSLFILITRDTAAEKIQENEFFMRCIMRVLISVREDIQPHLELVLNNFINIVKVIRHNPSNPQFYYYLFEGIGALIRFTAPAEPDKLEKAFYQPFAEILTDNVQEFMPYVFQLFAALLEANPSGALSEYYQSLIQPILTPSLWESKGNIPALARLLSSLVSRGGEFIANNNLLESVLVIFQKLIASKLQDGFGFDILEAVLASVPKPALEPFFTPMLNLLFTRLSSSKTESFTLRFVRLYHLFSALPNLGTDLFITISEQVQANVFTQLYLSIILPDTQKLTKPFDRKIAVVSLTKNLGDSEAFAEKYAKGWGFTCEAMLKLMLNPPVPPAQDDAIHDQDVDDAAFGVGFTALTTCRRPVRDPFPEVQDVRAWIGSYLKDADSRHGGRVTRFVGERLNDEQRGALVAYMGA
ncbi:hypothetical protein FH972_024912 [Carpinus fangiana]|uniref:Importin N-terminal domain-containing protein n=1 Tax=Carpinus fangiana TaxID=176857 RepID=A0A5N6KZP1_9ROSI|nr:hypothetical protein FH972_024912 [Carpinus fangiana]